MAGEVFGGWLADSLAIMTDAAHLLSDIAGFVVSLIALIVARRRASARHSFGLYRVEIIGAIISVLIIWVLTVFLVIEAVDRVRNPVEVDGMIVTVVAIVGLFINSLYVMARRDHMGK